MALTTEFIPLELDQLRREAAVLKADGWRFIQTHAVYTDDGVDLYYSFMKDGHAANYWVKGVQKGTPVPSITDLFLAAFVFENEARELFGVDMRDIAIDFAGAMYAPAVSEPMTIISPEQKAARDKARKAAAAKAAKQQEAAAGTNRSSRQTQSASEDAVPESAPTQAAGQQRVFVMTPERQARLDAKLPTLSEEKRAKVETALKARAAEAQAAMETGGAQTSQPVEPPAKELKPGASAGQPIEAPSQAQENAAVQAGVPASGEEVAQAAADPALERALSLLDGPKAAKVRSVLEGKALAPEAGSVQLPEKAATGEGPQRLADEQLESLVGAMDDAKAAIVRAALAAKGGN